MSSDSLGTFIHRLSGVYRDPQRVLRDAEFLLSSPLGTHLRPTTEPLMLNDGSSTPPVLLLRGTIPMTYRGVTYNLPIDMYLPPPYPLRPPTVFIRPVASMAIKENHRHVGLDGRVYLPYLHEWRPASHELRELAVWMSSLFGSEPPCYARPVNAAGGPSPSSSNGNNGMSNNGMNGHHRINSNPPPPPYASSTAGHSHTSSHASSAYSSMSTAASSVNTTATNNTNNAAAEEERRKAFEREMAEANAAAEVARQADAEEARMKSEEARMQAEQKRLERDHERTLSSARAMATSKVQFEMQTQFRGAKDELRLELKNQKQLEHGKTLIDKLVKEGEGRKMELQKGHEEMDESIETLEKWLDAVKEQQSTADAEATNNSEENGMTKADMIALPADTHCAQMLELSAENAAIDDCIYFLDRALVQGNISLDVFLKEVRKLSKRQFMAKAHLIKIAQTRAAEHR